MKKYPITYKNERYEVRWQTSGWFPHIIIYKETTFLNIKIYKEIFSRHEYIVNEYISLSENDPNYYIEQAKTIFKLWEQSETYKNNKELTRQAQQQKLAEWDGVIK